MSTQLKAPPVYRPSSSTQPSVQPKFRTESRPAPAAYRPQQAGSTSAQTRTSPQPQAQKPSPGQGQYQVSSPIWVASGRQQIRVMMKGSPTPIGSVDVHYKSGEAFISDLEVTQSHRRHGLATMLMKAAVNTARQNGSNVTSLEANPGPGSISKQALVGMYQKLGFKSAGTTQRGNPKMKTR